MSRLLHKYTGYTTREHHLNYIRARIFFNEPLEVTVAVRTSRIELLATCANKSDLEGTWIVIAHRPCRQAVDLGNAHPST